MRKSIPAVLLVLAAGWASAQEPPSSPPGQAPASPAMGKKEMTAIVVSTDATVKTITVRSDKSPASESQPKTLPVAGAAASYLETLKAGDKVKLTLAMDPATSKESVTMIEKEKDKAPPSNP